MMEILNVSNIKFVSLNSKFASANGRLILTKNYREFKKLLLDLFMFYGVVEKIEPPYKIIIELEAFIDIDNIIKPIFDIMEDLGIIDNDKNVLELKIVKKPAKRGRTGFLIVNVEGSVEC